MNILDYASRELDQEIDTVEIIPDHPDFVVIGTYNLQKRESTLEAEDDTQTTPASRRGSLQILSLKAKSILSFTPTRYDVPYAIVDIHFHPCIRTLLGAATSVGLVELFSIIAKYDNPDAKPIYFDIIHLSSIKAGHYDLSPNPPLVTQFVWLPGIAESPTSGDPPTTSTITFATCDSNGQSQTTQATISGSPTDTDQLLSSEVTEIHKQNYDLEAWCISVIHFPHHDQLPPSTRESILLSGGDDSCLIASLYTHDIQSSEIQLQRKLFTDKTTHAAGVVAILPLIPHNTTHDDDTIIPLLTGSYDETLRLFHLDTTSFKLRLHCSISIPGGGVWKIALLDQYDVPVPSPSNTIDTIDTANPATEITTTHSILLISAMHAGARIIRLTHTRTHTPSSTISASVSTSDSSPNPNWQFTIEASFTQAHESMVYACVAREVTTGQWDVLSTSFYDKRICDWTWRDAVKIDRETGSEKVIEGSQ